MVQSLWETERCSSKGLKNSITEWSRNPTSRYRIWRPENGDLIRFWAPSPKPVYNNKKFEVVQVRHTHTEEYGLVLRKEMLTHATTWMNLETSTVWLGLHGSHRLGRFVETAWGLPAARSCGRGMGTVLSCWIGAELLFRKMKSNLKIDYAALTATEHLKMHTAANYMLPNFNTI